MRWTNRAFTAPSPAFAPNFAVHAATAMFMDWAKPSVISDSTSSFTACSAAISYRFSRWGMTVIPDHVVADLVQAADFGDS